MNERERTDGGEFAETVTPSRVLEVFDVVEGPVVTSSDVSEELGCSDETARRKLQDLYNRGVLDRRKTGRTAIWWLAKDGDGDPNPVNPDDPIFTDRPTFASGRSDLSESVDEILYQNGQ